MPTCDEELLATYDLLGKEHNTFGGKCLYSRSDVLIALQHAENISRKVGLDAGYTAGFDDGVIANSMEPESDEPFDPPFTLQNMHGRPVFTRKLTSIDIAVEPTHVHCADCKGHANFLIVELNGDVWPYCGECDIGAV